MTFLSICKKQSTPIFIFFIAFIAIEFFLNYKVIQINPFQIWGVFSKPLANNDFVNVEILNVNDAPIQYFKLNNRLKLLQFNYTIKKYIELQKNEDPVKLSCLQINEKYNLPLEKVIDKVFCKRENTEQYPEWLYRYTQQFYNTQIEQLSVDEVTLNFNKKGQVELIKATNVLSYKPL